MTIVDESIFNATVGELSRLNHEVRHFSLIASKRTLEQRLTRRGDRFSWNFKQIERCLKALSREKFAKQIDTENQSLDQVVEQIAAACDLNLQKPRLSCLGSKIAWFRNTIGLIRRYRVLFGWFT